MWPNFSSMHIRMQETLPPGFVHKAYQTSVRQKAFSPVMYGQSSLFFGYYLKKAENVSYCNTWEGLSKRAKQHTLRSDLQRNGYLLSPCIRDQGPFMCKAKKESYAKPDIKASTFHRKRSTYQTDNSLRTLANAFSGSLESSTNILQVDDFGRELMILVVPAIMGQAIEPMAQLMETAYVGRLGPVELAAIGVSISVFNLITKLFNVPLLNVTTSFVAEDASRNIQSDGSHKENSELQMHSSDKTIRKQLPAVSTTLVLAAGIGIVEAAALAFGAGPCLNAMGIPFASPMRLPSQQYLALRALGAPAVVVSLAVQGVFRGLKDTKTSLYASGAGTILNALLFPFFIFTLRFGICGAAVATVASQYFIAFLLLWNLNKHVILLPQKLEELRFERYLKSGGLLLGRTVAVLVTMTLGTSMAARQGPVMMAGHQICLQVWLAVSLLTDALALAGQALIASAFTEKDSYRVKRIAFSILKIGLVSGIALAAILYVGFESFAKLFTKDAAVLEVVKFGVLFVAGSQPVNALAFIMDGLHYGVSDFAYAAYSMMIVGTISSAFLAFAPSYLGIRGVWLGLSLFMGLRMAAGLWRLRDENGPWGFLRQEVKMGIGY